MQYLDPKTGTQRKKSLMQQIAAKAMARKGFASKVGTFGRLAASGGQSRGLRPSKGAGAGKNVARPSAGMNSVFDGLHGNFAAEASPYVNTAPVAAPMPDMTGPAGLNPQQDAAQPADPLNATYAQVGGTNPDPAVAAAYDKGVVYANDPNTQAAVAAMDPNAGHMSNDSYLQMAQHTPGYPEYYMPGGDGYRPSSGGAGGVIGPSGYGQLPTTSLQQGSPSGTITAPGGLVPLGGGRYYDPATDTIRGGSGRSGTQEF